MKFRIVYVPYLVVFLKSSNPELLEARQDNNEDQSEAHGAQAQIERISAVGGVEMPSDPVNDESSERIHE